MSRKKTAILWVRNDFRLSDNVALWEASKYEELAPVYIWNIHDTGVWQAGAASKWWLHHTLKKFQTRLKGLGTNLIIFRGRPEHEISKIAKKINASAVLMNESYNPYDRGSESRLQRDLDSIDIDMQSFQGSLLCPIDHLLKKDGSPYLVYTPFWNNFLKKYESRHYEAPSKLPKLPRQAQSMGCDVDSLGLLPSKGWHEKFHRYWSVGEEEAESKQKHFIARAIRSYKIDRDIPASDGTSMLSPHFHFGEIHPQKIFSDIEAKFGKIGSIEDASILHFCKEIVWREFSYHLLYHFPTTSDAPLRENFKQYPWKMNNELFTRWRKGKTGYPIIDAGMRQLWSMGWMHNRLRMLTASFLVKHLGIPWQQGAKWFWDTLVDADLACNTQGWQWTAGCGADASPFFRIFNPITQGEKIDPKGEYISRWCPELAGLPSEWICKPWQAPTGILERAAIKLGVNYPLPIVDHKEARVQALWNYGKMKKESKG